jgi:maleamate amidohydrolase
MARIEAFEDHCWKDVISPDDIELYSRYRRETFIGPQPALLLIDLYTAVYRGGAHSPYELTRSIRTPAASTPTTPSSRRSAS